MNNQEIVTMIGQNVYRLRKLNKMSAKYLGELLGVTQGYVRLIERGKRGVSPKYLLTLSKIFDVPVSEFYAVMDDLTKGHDPLNVLKGQIGVSIQDMSEKELHFIIDMIPRLKSLR